MNKEQVDEIEDKYMDRIKELIAERDCWIDTANMFKDEQQKLIKSQAAELEKYKALCDQMGNALLISDSDFSTHIRQVKSALEAWRALK